MKPFLESLCFLAALLLFTARLDAAEFRFQCLSAGTTGLTHVVYDGQGQATTIIIARGSDAEAREILSALIQSRVLGTKGINDSSGAKWEQGIILIGKFTSKTKRTKYVPNGAPPEPYRDFRITGIKVLFPLSRFEIAAGGNPIDGPDILVTHFSFASLLPRGVVLNGKRIDLRKHAIERRTSR